VNGFRISSAELGDTMRWLNGAVERCSQLTLTVEPEEFGTWCAALGADAFHTAVTVSHRHLTFVGAVVESKRFGHVHVQVHTDRPPAPWVRYPPRGSEASRRWLFAAEVL
jgi:hypothetical protein